MGHRVRSQTLHGGLEAEPQGCVGSGPTLCSSWRQCLGVWFTVVSAGCS